MTPHKDVCVALVNLGRILCDMGDFRNALIQMESGLAILQKKDPTSSLTAYGMNVMLFLDTKLNKFVFSLLLKVCFGLETVKEDLANC